MLQDGRVRPEGVTIVPLNLRAEGKPKVVWNTFLTQGRNILSAIEASRVRDI